MKDEPRLLHSRIYQNLSGTASQVATLNKRLAAPWQNGTTKQRETVEGKKKGVIFIIIHCVSGYLADNRRSYKSMCDPVTQQQLNQCQKRVSCC